MYTLKISIKLNVPFINYSCKGRCPYITNGPFVSFLTDVNIFVIVSINFISRGGIILFVSLPVQVACAETILTFDNANRNE